MGGELMENQLKLASCQKSRLMKAQREETLRVPSAGDAQRSVWDGCVFYLWQSEQKHTS